MANPKREQEVLSMIVDALTSADGALAGRKVVLFGSRARGQARAHSDFDIGVVGDAPLPFSDYYAIEDKFDALPTLFKIDWVDFARASETFRSRALLSARVIHG